MDCIQSGPVLPAELWTEIISWLPDDKHTLSSLSLVSRTVGSVAQGILHSEIGKDPYRLILFLRRNHNKPHLAELIKDFTIILYTIDPNSDPTNLLPLTVNLQRFALWVDTEVPTLVQNLSLCEATGIKDLTMGYRLIHSAGYKDYPLTDAENEAITGFILRQSDLARLYLVVPRILNFPSNISTILSHLTTVCANWRHVIILLRDCPSIRNVHVFDTVEGCLNLVHRYTQVPLKKEITRRHLGPSRHLFSRIRSLNMRQDIIDALDLWEINQNLEVLHVPNAAIKNPTIYEILPKFRTVRKVMFPAPVYLREGRLKEEAFEGMITRWLSGQMPLLEQVSFERLKSYVPILHVWNRGADHHITCEPRHVADFWMFSRG